jgi:hypothetical protein
MGVAVATEIIAASHVHAAHVAAIVPGGGAIAEAGIGTADDGKAADHFAR